MPPRSAIKNWFTSDGQGLVGYFDVRARLLLGSFSGRGNAELRCAKRF